MPLRTEAESLIEENSDPRLSLLVRFNLAYQSLAAWGYEEARAMLPDVRELAMRMSNELDLVRVCSGWRDALLTGLGRQR